MTPEIEGLDATSFTSALLTASRREEVRQQMSDTSNQKSKEATPGPLISELKWTEWEPKFENFLSTILGFNGVPLSYILRENELPDKVGPHADFVDETIACTLLSGVSFEADRSTVHQYIVSFTSGQTSEDWI